MRAWQQVLNAVMACVVSASVISCGGGGSSSMVSGTSASGYVATSLVSNTNASTNPYASANVDPNLVNAWGIAFNPQGFAWVADNGTSMSTLYDGNGVPQSLVVAIPPGSAGSAAPTGIVFNGAAAFNVTQGGVSGPSAFIFVGEAGTVSGWSPNVNLNSAILVVDGATQGKVYKGLAIASVAGAPRLYAADFHNGVVDVFDAAFAPVVVAGAFTDANLPAGYAPFGIQAIGNQIFVAFAMRDPNSDDELDGAGLGAIDVFDPSGNLVTRLVAPGGKLNAPWGLALAPADFGPFSNALLVGNFGDGTINAFDATTGASLGPLTQAGMPIFIDGLWGLAFGNGLNAQPANTLFFTAGPAQERNGVFGRIDFH
ncbi:MAG TPA: TIGR03118 family protein [Caldimonas sp.]